MNRIFRHTGLKHIWLYLSCQLLSVAIVYCQHTKEQWLQQLNKDITAATIYDAAKLKRIDSLRQLTPSFSGIRLYEHLADLQREYSVFNFDSAHSYVNKMMEVSIQTGNAELSLQTRLRKIEVLLSVGMFTEAMEMIHRLDRKQLKGKQLFDYYITCSRIYFDLADYGRNVALYASQYDAIGSVYTDSILTLAKEGSFHWLFYSGHNRLRAGDIRGANGFLRKLVDNPRLTQREKAISFSTYGDLFIRRKMTDSAIIYLAKAAIADIRSSTKETTAFLNLANLLFEQGDIENASTFILKAAADARLFGARQRLVQLSSILPLITSGKVASIQSQKYTIRRYAIIITLVAVPLLLLGIVITSQVRKLKKQRKEINLRNNELYHLIDEKEWLIKEIHHRVKNNLHTINSLLESQSAYLRNDALMAIRDSQRRIFAMSLIHQKLYQPGTSSAGIDMPAYILDLIHYLQESFETGNRIRFETHLHPLVLDISLAVPIGLILNETITNSLKYAFPVDRNGLICIEVTNSDEGSSFSVADDGVGIPPGYDILKADTLGIKLMKGLSAEIDATFTMKNKNGTTVLLELKKNEKHARPKLL